MIEKLLRCAQCNQVIPRTALFGDFGEHSLLCDVEWSSEDLDREKEFFLLHAGHILEELSVDLDTFVSDKPSYEPVKTSYVEATNGSRRFVIKRTRPSLDRPILYELMPGATRVSDVAPELRDSQDPDELPWLTDVFATPEENAMRSLELFRKNAESPTDEDLVSLIQRISSGEPPLLPFGSFSENLRKALQGCREDLPECEINLIRDFIRDHRGTGETPGLQTGEKTPVRATRAPRA